MQVVACQSAGYYQETGSKLLQSTQRVWLKLEDWHLHLFRLNGAVSNEIKEDKVRFDIH